MDALRVILLICHLAALAGVVVAFVAHLSASRSFLRVLAGAAGGLLGTGLLLLAVDALDDESINWAKMITKLVISTAVLAAALLARSREDGERPGTFFYGAGLLALVNTIVAVAWT
ncbi:hypothetical protein ETD83_26270 [Actinomadura soli]|uniref:Integral membrane protein n=1 Tax=Actinomadura soli TaxID=2508997 RepID=A0A5C4J8Q2_9ACTN|nr:hypothetical protein [Actinomadura soli]TMQ92953.1 hypothetical protein ETD83_26270 [Actinomadura soli]